MKRVLEALAAAALFVAILFAFTFADVVVGTNISRVIGTFAVATFLTIRFYKFRLQRQNIKA